MNYNDYLDEVRTANYYVYLYYTKIAHDIPLDQYRISDDLERFILAVKAADLILPSPYEISLGHTIKDEDFVLITYDKQLKPENNNAQRPFTLAEEFGHVVLHHPIELEATVTPEERRKNETSAHIFAANLLLPIQVLLTQIVAKQFHFFRICAASSVPYKITEYRLMNILERRFDIDTTYATIIVTNYKKCKTKDEVKNSTLYKLFNYYWDVFEDEKIEQYDYVSHRDRLAPMATKIISEIKEERFLALEDEIENSDI